MSLVGFLWTPNEPIDFNYKELPCVHTRNERERERERERETLTVATNQKTRQSPN